MREFILIQSMRAAMHAKFMGVIHIDMKFMFGLTGPLPL